MFGILGSWRNDIWLVAKCFISALCFYSCRRTSFEAKPRPKVHAKCKIPGLNDKTGRYILKRTFVHELVKCTSIRLITRGMKHRIILEDREAKIWVLAKFSKDALSPTMLEGERMKLGSEVVVCFNDTKDGHKLWFGRVQAMLQFTGGGKGKIPVFYSPPPDKLPQSL